MTPLLRVVVVWSCLAVAVGAGPGDAQAAATPAVSALSARQGPSAGGGTLVISGGGFEEATSVRFGPATQAAFTVESDTTIRAVVPPGPDGQLVAVRVSTATGTSTSGSATTYYYSDPPVVTGVTPRSGPSSAPTLVTISGTGFNRATAVRFNQKVGSVEVRPPGMTVHSDTRITAWAPAGTETSGEVQVIEGFQISPRTTAGLFTWVGPLLPYGGTPGAPRLVLVGDSILGRVSGAAMTRFGPRYQVTAKTRGGYRAAELLPYVEALPVDPSGPSRVVVIAGTYDAIQQALAGLGGPTEPVIDLAETADRIADLARAVPPGACAVLTTINASAFPDPVGVGGLNTTMRTLADASAGRIQVADWDAAIQAHAAAAGQPGWVPWTTDTIHPSPAGTTALLGLVDEALDRCAPAPPTVDTISPPVGPAAGGHDVVITGTGLSGATAVRFGPTTAATIRSITDTRIVVEAPPLTGPALLHLRVVNPRGTSPTHLGTLYAALPAPW